MKHVRVMNKFSWVPHQDQPKHPAIPTPHRKPELRRPLYMLSYGETSSDDNPFLRDLYFVNLSDEVLDSVSTGSGGFETIGDDEVMPVSGPGYFYESVQPNEAVKVEQYDLYYDSDFMLGISIQVKSPSRGLLDFSSMSKGGADAGVLLWDSEELGKYVGSKTRANPDVSAQKERLKNPVKFPLGKEFGLKRSEDLGDGRVLRVENDDWGHMVCVIDKDDFLIWGYKLVVDDNEIEDVIAEAKRELNVN